MNMKFIKIILCMLFIFGTMIMVSQVNAKDNKTEEWHTQLVYDTVNGCYQGTYRWIILANPALIGRPPPPVIQRQMINHCFCVLDKVRVEFSIEEYVRFARSSESLGDLFLKKAYECIREFDTMRGIILMQNPLDNATKTDNGTIEKLEVLPAEPEEPEESSPDEKLNDQQTILQG